MQGSKSTEDQGSKSTDQGSESEEVLQLDGEPPKENVNDEHQEL